MTDAISIVNGNMVEFHGPVRTTIYDHWDQPGMVEDQAHKLATDPTLFINNLLGEIRFMEQKVRDRSSEVAMLREHVAKAETQKADIERDLVGELKATETLDAIKDVLREITKHQGRCAAVDICGDHDRIVTLAKVLNDYLADTQ